MPSLASIAAIEAASALPAVSSSVCTTYQMLSKLSLKTAAPLGGTLLSGKFGRVGAT
jgi:maleate isomerase